MNLDSLKYAELQQLAKSFGLKANMKADKLLRALKQRFEERSENGNVTSDEMQCSIEEPAQPIPPSNALVTMRRGKTKNVKRKLSEDEASDLDPKLQESAVQDNGKSDDVEGNEGRRSSKRRKVSLTKDTQSPVPPEIPNQNQAERKSESAGKKAGTEKRNKESAKKSAGKIPCHEGLMKKKAALRPTTPNFRKLHEAHFNKMESIDSYVQRKNKQMDVLRNSVKELKAQIENPSKPAETKTQTKPPAKRPSLFSPGVPVRRPEKSRVTPTSKSALKESAPFKPTVLSTHKINVRFSKGTQDNEHKRSLLKTPARMSAVLALTPVLDRKSTGPANRTPGIDPFIFSGSGTPATNKKKAFDLKASLSRPLAYKPHKGKLKPFGTTEENAPPEKTQMVPSHQKNYKWHQVQTREERRNKHTEDRKQKKEKLLGARRGVVVA